LAPSSWCSIDRCCGRARPSWSEHQDHPNKGTKWVRMTYERVGCQGRQGTGETSRLYRESILWLCFITRHFNNLMLLTCLEARPTSLESQLPFSSLFKASMSRMVPSTPPELQQKQLCTAGQDEPGQAPPQSTFLRTAPAQKGY